MHGLTVWRHPPTRALPGLCVGRTDVAVDRRKAKRLAHRIRAWARRQGLPRIVVTSPLQRSASVGHCLARWGWRHRVDARLVELDFGDWDGRPWCHVAQVEVDAWCADFANHRPGGGETVAALLARCAQFIAESSQACVVSHAGWISAAQWSVQAEGATPEAVSWPAAVAHGARLVFSAEAAGRAAGRAAPAS